MGSPWERGAVEDLSQERAVPVIFKTVLRQETKMEWLMVSNAALRLSRRRMLRLPASEEGQSHK